MTWRARWRPAGALLAVAAARRSPCRGPRRAPALERAVIGAGALSVQIDDLEPAIPSPATCSSCAARDQHLAGARALSVRRAAAVAHPDGESRRDPRGPGGVSASDRESPGHAAGPDELAPGATQTFELSADVDRPGPDELPAPTSPAPRRSATPVRAWFARTWTAPSCRGGRREPRVEPLLLTTIWPLSGPPLRDARGHSAHRGRRGADVTGRAPDPPARCRRRRTRVPCPWSWTRRPSRPPLISPTATGCARPEATVEPGTRSQEVGVWLADLTAALTAPGVDVPGSLYAWLDVDAARRGKVLGTALRQEPALDAEVAEILGRRLQHGGPRPRRGRPAQHPQCPGEGPHACRRALRHRRPAGRAHLLHGQRERADPDTGAATSPALLADSRIAATLALPMDTWPSRPQFARPCSPRPWSPPASSPRASSCWSPDWTRLGPPGRGGADGRGALTGAPWVDHHPARTALARDPGTLARVPVAPTAEEVAAELAGTTWPGSDPSTGACASTPPSCPIQIDPAGDPDGANPAARVLVPGPPRATNRPHRARRQADRGAHRVRARGVQRIDHHLREPRGRSRSRWRTTDRPTSRSAWS